MVTTLEDNKDADTKDTCAPRQGKQPSLLSLCSVGSSRPSVVYSSARV